MKIRFSSSSSSVFVLKLSKYSTSWRFSFRHADHYVLDKFFDSPADATLWLTSRGFAPIDPSLIKSHDHPQFQKQSSALGEASKKYARIEEVEKGFELESRYEPTLGENRYVSVISELCADKIFRG